MIYAQWTGEKIPILNDLEINLSSREVTFSDLTLDFAGQTISDLPYYLQETQIVDDNDNVLFTGYVDTYTLPQIKQKNQVEMELSLTLLSPRKMTTKRVTSINKTDTLENIIREIFSVLFADGYYFKKLNVPNKSITIRRLSRTIEEIIEEICSKNSLYWNIDIDKGITVCSIDYMFSKDFTKTLDITNYKNEIKGLISITPTVEGIDYANVINAKNGKVFYTTRYHSSTPLVTINAGDVFEFENPIIVGTDTARRITGNPDYVTEFPHLQIEYTNTNDSDYGYINSILNDGADYIEYENIGKNDEENKDWTLQYDSFYTNMITGIKNNTESTQSIILFYTRSALRKANMKLLNWEQIEEMKGNVTMSGQIEKIIELNEKWFTTEELINYINNLFVNNDKNTNEITMVCDEDNNINIGDRIVVNLPEYLVEGNFIVTDIKKNKSDNDPFIYTIILRNTGLLENYIDFFRPELTEEQEDDTQIEYIVEYTGQDSIIEVNEVTTIEN
jgi:hypothetical protein